MDEIKKYLIKFSDETIKGPLLKEEIEDMIYDNILSGDELIKEYPEGEWVNISSVKHFYDVFIGFFELEKNINSNKKKTIIDFKTEKVKKPEDLDKTKILKKETKEKTEIYTEQEKEKISNLVIKDKIKASLNTEEKSPLIPRSVIKTKTDEIKKKDKTPIIVITIIVLASILFFIPKDKEQKISIEGVEVKKELIELKLPVAESEDYSPTESRRLRLRALELLEKDNINSYNAAITDLLEGFRLNISNGALLSYLAYTYANLYGISKRDAEFLNALKSIITRAERTDVNVESLALAQISFLNITNRFDESINIFNSILTKVENLSDVSPLLLILAADTSIKNSDYQTAYKIIEQLKEMYPERFPRIYYLEGMIRKNNRELDLATKSFEQALKINPSHSQSQVELFIINQESSINNILKFLATNSPNTNHEDISKLLVILANRLAEEKDTIKAKNLYKKALDFYPANTDALIAYERLGGDINKYQNLALLDPAKQADLNVFLLRGDELMNVYKYRDAALQYRMATSINDKDSIAWYKLGVAYSFSYEYEKAISSFKKSLEINSLDINTLIKLARVQIDLYMFVEASENLERALKLDPEHPDTIFTIGYLNDKRNLEKEAIDYYHKAVSKDFSHKEALFILGEKNFKYERYPEAKLLFEKVLTAKPDDFASYMYIIRILSKTEHIDKVKRYVDNLEKIFPNAAEVNTGMALAYMDRSDYITAEYELKKALKKNKYSVQALEAYAELSARLGRNKEALEYLETIAIISPYYLDAINKKILIYKELGHLGECERELVRLVEIAPFYPRAYYRLGYLYYANNKQADAEEAVLREIKNNPNIVDSYLLLGDIYLKSNQAPKAVQLFRKLLSKNPKDAYGLIGLAKSFYHLKDFSSSLSFITQARHVDSNIAEIYYVECLLYYQMNMLAESKYACDEFLKRDPTSINSTEVKETISKIMERAQ